MRSVIDMTCCRKHTMILGDARLMSFDIIGMTDDVVSVSAEWRLYRNAEMIQTGNCTVDRTSGQVTFLLSPDQRGRHYVDVTISAGREIKTERVLVNVI